MHISELAEARIDDTNNVLVSPASSHDAELARDFFGTVIAPEDIASGSPDLAQKTVYLCGDLPGISDGHLREAARVIVIRDPGRVPIRVHGVGVFYRRFFDPDAGHFGRIRTEHEFQSLTESTKPGTAHRSGIYLTPVTQDGDELHFRLLRCSTNFSGPTENFRPTDTQIVEALNREADTIFQDPAPLNHVLAQIYHNTLATAERKQSKAKISSHADKTKDMPVNGIMAFCTFYDELDKVQPLARDAFDWGIKGISGLTRLQFRLKDPTEERDQTAFPEQFSVTLYPGSVFFMPLSTNRLYTHEIRPSALSAELLPTRLGYVVRCSDAEAVHKNGDTYLKVDGDLVKLEPPTPEDMDALRGLYAEENRSSAFIDYGEELFFSMNMGDYVAPRL